MSARARDKMLAWSVPMLSEIGALLRSVLLAWAAGPEELGRAMMLVLVLRLTEMISDIGVERLLMTAREGDDPDFIAALQGAALLRGLAMAVMLMLLAVPMAYSLADGASLQTYLALAIIPLLRGFLNLDYRKSERNFRYGPMAIVEGGSVVLMLLALPVIAQALPDHRAMLLALIVQALAQVALSHLVAKRRWRMKIDPAILHRAFSFGTPLVVNAFLMFLTFQADRLIVAGWFGWAEVGIYGVALQLASLPAQIAGRAAGSLLAPRLRVALQDGKLRPLISSALKVHLALAAAFALGFAALAPFAIEIVYGTQFRPSFPLALALGLAAAFRILRTPHSQLAVATGRTADPARANFWRAMALLPALCLAIFGQPLLTIALAAMAGEMLATLRAHFLMQHSFGPLSKDAL
jgi:O-antigen/teichoic acid export membrane protein